MQLVHNMQFAYDSRASDEIIKYQKCPQCSFLMQLSYSIALAQNNSAAFDRANIIVSKF